MVHPPHPRLDVDGVEALDPREQVAELVLAVLGEQEVVERLEAAALVGGGDVGAVADEGGEQLALGALPGGDPLTGGPIECPEVLLDLAEVGQQLAGGAGEELVALAEPGTVEHPHLAGLDLGDLAVGLLATAAQLGEPGRGIDLGAVHHLAQQVDQGVQP